MRSVVIATCLVVMFASHVQAQQRQKGVKAGATFPAVVIDPDDEEADYGRRTAGTFGGFIVFPVTDRVAAQIEALYSPRGGKVTSDLSDETATLKLDYFEVPVLTRFTATRSAKRSFFVFAGPSLAIRTGAKLEVGTTGGGFVYGVSEDVGDSFRRFDVGLVAGAGVDIGEWVVIDGRYVWGLMNIDRGSTTDVSVHSRVLTFMVGVRF